MKKATELLAEGKRAEGAGKDPSASMSQHPAMVQRL